MSSAAPSQPLSPRHELAAPAMPRAEGTADILGPVLGVGKNGVRVGAGLGILLAAVLHGYMVFRVYNALWGIEGWIRSSRAEMTDFFLGFGPEVETKPEEKKEEEKKKSLP